MLVETTHLTEFEYYISLVHVRHRDISLRYINRVLQTRAPFYNLVTCNSLFQRTRIAIPVQRVLVSHTAWTRIINAELPKHCCLRQTIFMKHIGLHFCWSHNKTNMSCWFRTTMRFIALDFHISPSASGDMWKLRGNKSHHHPSSLCLYSDTLIWKLTV